MRWIEVRFESPFEASEAISALLHEWPEVHGVAIEGRVEKVPRHLEYGEWFDESLLKSDRVTITVYLPEGSDSASIRDRLAELFDKVAAAGLDIGDGLKTLRLQSVDETDWEAAWKEHFHPLPIGQQLVIVPKWEEASYDPERRLPIVLEPGMAFGTGTHATTQLCLEALEDLSLAGKSVIDIGCGTAVLSIAAAKLGACAVTAVDIDPVAVHVAQQNAAENKVLDVMRVVEGDLMREVADEVYDVAIANILRDAVIALTPQAASRLQTHGQFVVSGFVTEQSEAVRAALERHGFRVIRTYTREDWVVLVAEKTP